MNLTKRIVTYGAIGVASAAAGATKGFADQKGVDLNMMVELGPYVAPVLSAGVAAGVLHKRYDNPTQQFFEPLIEGALGAGISLVCGAAGYVGGSLYCKFT